MAGVYIVEEQLRRASRTVNWMKKSLDANRYVNETLEEIHRVSWNAYMRAQRNAKKLETLTEMRVGASESALKIITAKEHKHLGAMFFSVREIWRNYTKFCESAAKDWDFELAEPLPETGQND